MHTGDVKPEPISCDSQLRAHGFLLLFVIVCLFTYLFYFFIFYAHGNPLSPLAVPPMTVTIPSRAKPGSNLGAWCWGQRACACSVSLLGTYLRTSRPVNWGSPSSASSWSYQLPLAALRRRSREGFRSQIPCGPVPGREYIRIPGVSPRGTSQLWPWWQG